MAAVESSQFSMDNSDDVVALCRRIEQSFRPPSLTIPLNFLSIPGVFVAEFGSPLIYAIFIYFSISPYFILFFL